MPVFIKRFTITTPAMRTIIPAYFIVLLASGCLMAVTASCGLKSESNVSSGNRAQILHFGNGDEPQELDPHITTGIPEFNIQHALFEGIVAKHPKDLGIEPGVAESWEISDDLITYTFNFRRDARWSNGDIVTAHDFVYSWRRALTPALGNLYGYMFFYIKNAEAYYNGEITDFSLVGVKALDDFTLQVELKAPTPFFLQLLDHHSYFPVHPATIEKFGAIHERGTRWTRPGNFVGNGPFTLKEWKMNRILTVEKSPTYWDADRVRLQEIHFYPIPNASTEELMFRSGQLHVTSRVPNEKIEGYRQEKPESLSITPYLGTYFYRFNTTVKPLDDVRVRRALAMCINRVQIVERITKGGQIPAYTFTPPDTNGYTSDAAMPYDVTRARELLAEAGFPDGSNFPTLEIIFNTDEAHRKIAIAIQEMWKKTLNINITLSNNDWKVYLDRESNLDYQISRAAWIGDYLDPNTFLDMFVTGGGNNRTGWSNLRYDQLIGQAALTAEQGNRYALLREAEQILIEEAPVVPIYTYTRVTLISPAVKGWEPNLLDQHPYKYVYLEGHE
jgi:oligopeptide transport system substrate-binding protein